MNTDSKSPIFTQQLNPSQQQAVLQDSGPLLVIAGAGSGKTRVITSRIAHLMLNKGCSARNILALTFTNKAAQEMKERIEHFLGGRQDLPFIGTFHSYCLRLLKQNNHLLEHPFISILDEDDQQKIIQGIITRHNMGKQTTAKQLAYHISHIKNNHSDTLYKEWLAQNPLFDSVYKSYEQEKRASKCLDFDDLLIETVQLFKKNPGFKLQFQQMVRHILVDEYQDTNVVQHELLKQLTLNDQQEFISDSLCVVGDEDQSIYSWRGATIANIINFKKDYPTTQLIKIEQNYRSAQPILDAANQVIINNKNRNPKKLWSTKEGNDRIRLMACQSDYHEADVIAHAIKTRIALKKESSIALLYRTHFQSRSLEEALIKQSIPYKIIGGVQFYERKEIKDLLAYLRLIINPFDRASLFRVINVPTRGLGAKFEEEFQTAWQHEPFLSFKDIALKLMSAQPKSKQESIQSFLQVFTDLSDQTAPSKALEKIITATGYRAFIKESYDPEDANGRLENIKELINAVHHFESEKQISISGLLDEIALMQATYQKNEELENNPVLMMTLHAAKGLEFDMVILAGLEDGILPSTRSLMDADAIEEERRLLYVGITRAKEYLLITQSKYRYTFGTMSDQRPSRFLKEIDPTLLVHQDCSHWHGPQLSAFFKEWLSGRKPTMPSQVFTFNKTKPIIAQIPEATNTDMVWKKNQPVKHEVFGIGVVQEIETKADNTTYLTISFKKGIKKIASSFVSVI